MRLRNRAALSTFDFLQAGGVQMLNDVSYYLRRAAELEAMAEHALTEGHRLDYLRLARTWSLLADERLELPSKPHQSYSY